ncbi:FAST kinase domain-containing protein 3, mitochondrial [Amphibalanus amphitrite]|uniref:FAST kinase domain-containing protein 3, mitochondrial n=1 Tax=Amphibalanus amphitrite TaxID=1232801 RepID=A0A6A4WPL7_AMPAM|nr:FAST kinase domain-containing protein 3, mitochondrial-like [Amphibalanus amphitrite]XP_043188671.1 FAST kinase domain-containing protein 3, mitochondrial-like [Amphibalanus amphitrite]XP_043188672.1 FAST kinase domain-containing protein 3, mitochondrial-like [Amphibalanus amphitrite]XP_043188673.1 FAST kinase domain-containing protein 3, mitochondrial-like [Amphibalanus amphitrite]KAF0307229.1 FAST kinase domain-containing protein 3, mitochondrial [Amphibalanus amphitrite]KAF0307230.1 FAST
MFGRHLSMFKPHIGQVRSLLRPSNQFGNSIILLQDGLLVQELPVLVRHTSDHSFIIKNFGPVNSHEVQGSEAVSNNVSKNKSELTEVKSPTSDEEEFVGALTRTGRVGHIYRLLETATIEGITPFVALKALIRIAQLESREDASEADKTFARQAVIQKLMRTVLDGGDNETLVNTFTFMKDLKPLGSLDNLWQELQSQCIDKAATGMLTISQIARVIKSLHAVNGTKSAIADHLWQGIKVTASQIDETNIADLCSILPLLKYSNKVVFHTLMDQLPSFWWKLTPDTACSVMDSVHVAGLGSLELCRILVRWTSLSLHQLSEQHLRVALSFFCAAGHCDDTLQRVAERYCRARGRSDLRTATVAALATFALRFNIRSEVLLETASDHFVSHQSQYAASASPSAPAGGGWRLLQVAPPPPGEVTVVVRALGELDHQPRDRVGFFAAVERHLSESFSAFSAEEVLDICLACVYLRRYPLNFFRQVFNPFFLERVPAGGPDAQRLRTKLSALDCALTFECPGYRGPMLPRDLSARSVARDARAARLAHTVAPQLRAVSGVSQVEPAGPLPQLPLHPLYLPDLTCRRGDGRRLCLFLNPPERYARGTEHPLGPLQLRRRQLRQLGLAAVDLPLRQLAQMVVHPALLRKRLADAVAEAD